MFDVNTPGKWKLLEEKVILLDTLDPLMLQTLLWDFELIDLLLPDVWKQDIGLSVSIW